MRIRVSAVLLSAISCAALAAVGDRDSAFLQGQPLLLSSVAIDRVESIVVADDASFTVTGRCAAAQCVARFLADGSRDLSFGRDGVLTLSATEFSDPVAVFEYQEDGEVDDDEDGESDDDDDADDIISHHFRVVSHDAAHANRLLIARFTQDGVLDGELDVSEDADDDDEEEDGDDTDDVDEDADEDGVIDENYDEDGIAELFIGGVDVRAQAAASDALGRIVIAGSAQLRVSDTHRKLVLTRVTTDGLLDATLYGSGKQYLTLAAHGETYTPVVDQVMVDNRYRIVISGHSIERDHNVGFVIRLSATGVLDSDFDGDGIRVWYPDNGDIQRVRFALNRDDQIALVADYRDDDLGAMSEIHILNSDGSDDGDFNLDGGQLLQPGGHALSAQTIAWQYDNGVIISGVNTAQQLVVARFNADGQLGNTGGDVWHFDTVNETVATEMTRGGRFMLLTDDRVVALTGDQLTPSAFAFAAQTDAALSTLTPSEAILISGLDRASLVSVEDGTIAINDEDECDTTLTRYSSLVIENGDYLCAFVTSSDEYDSDVVASLRIGNDVKVFSVSTEEEEVDGNIISGGSGSVPLTAWLFAITLLLWRITPRQR